MIPPDVTTLASALAERYRLERELGAGGMATVYLAEDLKHHRKVAIKVLKPELAAVIGAARFVREIQTIAALQHPHILGLIDSGETDGTAWYVMPFVDGESLRDRLSREKQLPIADAMRIAGEVASALDYAHRHGVIHRDIKPENILLHDGAALVADFGIALAVSSAGGGRMTETGMSLGTPQYMSPEQAMGEREIGPTSDVYSLGCVAYEMLTGEPPFTGSTAQAIVARTVTESPRSIAAQRPTVSPAIDAAILTALQKLPADRFPTARAFAEALSDSASRTTRLAPIATPAHQRWPLRAAVSAAVVMAGLALWGWLRPARGTLSNAVPFRLAIALPDSALPSNGVTISPDGAIIVYSSTNAGVTQLYRLQVTTGRLDPIAGSRGGTYPKISPDGRRVVYLDSDGLKILPVEGGTPTRVPVTTPWSTTTTWLDDTQLLVDGDTGVLRVPLDGGQPVQLTAPDTGEYAHLFAAPISPSDGILFCVVPINRINDVTGYRIAAVRPNGGKPVILTPGYQARFLAPDRLIVNRGDGTVVSIPFDPKRLRLTGAPTTIVSGPYGGSFTNSGLFDVASTGRVVVEYGDDSKPLEAVWVDRRGNVREFGHAWRANFVSLTLSPDGSRIAAGLYTQVSEEIQVRDVLSGSQIRITDAGAQLRYPVWAPDGNTLFHVAIAPGRSEVRQIAPGGVAPPRSVLRTQAGSVASWLETAPDGRLLYMSEHPAGTERGSDIASIALPAQDPPQRVVVSQGLNPVPSPDNRWLAYRVPDNAGTTTLMVRSTNPTRSETWQVATSVQTRPRWSRDGGALYYVAGDSMRVVSVASGSTFRITARQTLFALGTLASLFDVAPDGQFIMARRLPASASALDLLLLDNWARSSF